MLFSPHKINIFLFSRIIVVYCSAGFQDTCPTRRSWWYFWYGWSLEKYCQRYGKREYANSVIVALLDFISSTIVFEILICFNLIFSDAKTSLISCMKNKKNDANTTAHSSMEESTQKIFSPQKKSLSFASSSTSPTNNSSFSKNSLDDLFEHQEGIAFSS